MNRMMIKCIKMTCLAIVASLGTTIVAWADGGMWMLPFLRQQNYEKMVKMGLKLKPNQIYNPNGTSLTDGVVQFGRGCTGEVISKDGLVLTNHHCGFDEIQQHSTLEHNYLRDGFYASSLQQELPNPGLTVTFTERIVDVTAYVNNYLKEHHCTDPMQYLSRRYLSKIADKWYSENYQTRPKGTALDLAPFYEGNKYYLFVRKVYSDIRLVAAPPSCIGKYGADTDNWVWPRHSGDFSLFRIYADKNGNPADYSPDNIPLKPKFYFTINIKGLHKDDFVMILGFPGRTNHFYTDAEVNERQQIDNTIRIKMRDVRQQTMLKEMRADEKVNIQYAAKYSGSTNAYKNAIGSNWAIKKMDMPGLKRQQQEALIAYAKKTNQPQYIAAIDTIKRIVSERAPLRRQLWMIEEGLLRSLETMRLPLLHNAKEYEKTQTTPTLKEKYLSLVFVTFFNNDYNPMVDRKVTKAMLKAYIKDTPREERPQALKGIAPSDTAVDAYVDSMMDQTIYRSRAALSKALSDETFAIYEKDPLVLLINAVWDKYRDLREEVAGYDRSFDKARKTYVAGLLAMNGEMKMWPDANFTIRYTFGKVKGYSPRDDVHYGYQTTMKGVMEKEDPTNPEYTLLPKVKQIYQTKDFGPYAMADGRMPVDICATTHTTGGNSGSPLIDGSGYLVGINFDRNWEGVGGDITYLPDYQRSITCDIRYVLMVIDKYLGGDRLIKEMTIHK